MTEAATDQLVTIGEDYSIDFPEAARERTGLVPGEKYNFTATEDGRGLLLYRIPTLDEPTITSANLPGFVREKDYGDEFLAQAGPSDIHHLRGKFKGLQDAFQREKKDRF